MTSATVQTSALVTATTPRVDMRTVPPHAAGVALLPSAKVIS